MSHNTFGRFIVAVAICAATTWVGGAQSQDEPALLDYTVDDLVDLYVELALSEEAGADNDNDGYLHKWPPGASVRIFPQPSATLINRYGVDLFVDETKRIADRLASMVAHPKVVTFRSAELEEFARQARLDGTGTFFESSVGIFVAPRDELFERMHEIDRQNPVFPDAFLTELPRMSEPICAGWTTIRGASDWSLYRGVIFIEYSDRLGACLYEEIMQSFRIANDFPAGTPSIFNDDNAHGEPTELDLLLWRVHGNPRLVAGMAEDQVRPIARQLIVEFLAPK
jgi:hypothetical protein